MLIEISSRNVELNEKHREWVERRSQFALGRFKARIRRVSVAFSDINGDRGGVDKTCRLRVMLIPEGNVIVEDIDTSIETVVAIVSDRAARSVARRVERQNDYHTQAKREVVVNAARFGGYSAEMR